MSWGLADFQGGIQSRRLPALWVVLLSQACGLMVVLAIVAARGRGAPDLGRLLPGAGAGAAGAVGLLAFYRAMAIGTMSIVAPIAATGMCLPAAVGIAQGEHPGSVRLVGMMAALAGVMLASRESTDSHDACRVARLSIVLAIVAAAGFGTFALGLRSSARADVLWSLVAARAGSLALLVAAVAVVRPPLPKLARSRVPIAAVGVLDVSANGLYALATRHGLLSVVAVGSSLYPLVTVILARMLLGERVRASQDAGVAAALAGVVLIAAG